MQCALVVGEESGHYQNHHQPTNQPSRVEFILGDVMVGDRMRPFREHLPMVLFLLSLSPTPFLPRVVWTVINVDTYHKYQRIFILVVHC